LGWQASLTRPSSRSRACPGHNPRERKTPLILLYSLAAIQFVCGIQTKTADAKLVEDLHETEYGEKQYAAENLGGHPWFFSQHARDLNPDEWGATIVNRQ
jgi:hypothetical protein